MKIVNQDGVLKIAGSKGGRYFTEGTLGLSEMLMSKLGAQK